MAGPGVTCDRDNVCNFWDDLGRWAKFQGLTNCTCPPPGAGAPEPPDSSGAEPRVVALASLSLVASQRRAVPGDVVSVDVLLDQPLADLVGYQLEVRAGGGTRGQLELIDISVTDRKDYAFAELGIDQRVFSPARSAMFAGLPTLEAVTTVQGTYLATFTFRVSADAAGTFVVDLSDWALRGDLGQQSFLATSDFGMIAVGSTMPAVIVVTAGRAGSIRR